MTQNNEAGEKMTNEDIAWDCVKEIGTDGDANPTGIHESINMIANALVLKDTIIAQKDAEFAKLNKAFADLDAQIAIQESEPSTKTDSYMAGLLNGMLLAKANLVGTYNPVSYKDAHSATLKSKLAVAVEGLDEAKHLCFDENGEVIYNTRKSYKIISEALIKIQGGINESVE